MLGNIASSIPWLENVVRKVVVGLDAAAPKVTTLQNIAKTFFFGIGVFANNAEKMFNQGFIKMGFLPPSVGLGRKKHRTKNVDKKNIDSFFREKNGFKHWNGRKQEIETILFFSFFDSKLGDKFFF